MQSDIYLNTDIWIYILHFLKLYDVFKIERVSKKFTIIAQTATWNFEYRANKNINESIYKYNIKKFYLSECDFNVRLLKHINDTHVSQLCLIECVLMVGDDLHIHSVTDLTLDGYTLFTHNIIKLFDNLTSLNIYRVDISDDDFLDINFRNIKHLDLIRCPNITDIGLKNISTTSAGNKFERLKIFQCHQITNSEILHITSSDVTTNIFLSDNAAIRICKHLNTYNFLEYLELDGDVINDFDLKDISKFTFSLKYLHINSNQITDRGMKFLKKSNIQNLILYRCAITDKSIKYIGHIPQLELVLCNVLGDGLKYLSTCHTISLDHHLLMPPIDCFKYFNNIQILSLDNIPITNKHLKYLNTPTIRKELSIYECHFITNKGLIFVGKWQSIDIDVCDKIKSFEYKGSYQEVAEEIMRQYICTYMQ